MRPCWPFGNGHHGPDRSDLERKGGLDMIIQHGGRRPDIDPRAWIAPNAVVSGAVSIGADTRVLYGAVLTAEAGAEMGVGAGCVIMEQAVLRASGRFPLHLGEGVLVGPHAYVTGCDVGARSFIATGAMVFNGARVGEACVVALGGQGTHRLRPPRWSSRPHWLHRVGSAGDDLSTRGGAAGPRGPRRPRFHALCLRRGHQRQGQVADHGRSAVQVHPRARHALSGLVAGRLIHRRFAGPLRPKSVPRRSRSTNPAGPSRVLPRL